MDSLDLERMKTALSEAEKALAEGEIPVGAALYRGGTLLWADHNRREQRKDPTAHACLRSAGGPRVPRAYRLGTGRTGKGMPGAACPLFPAGQSEGRG